MQSKVQETRLWASWRNCSLGSGASRSLTPCQPSGTFWHRQILTCLLFTNHVFSFLANLMLAPILLLPPLFRVLCAGSQPGTCGLCSGGQDDRMSSDCPLWQAHSGGCWVRPLWTPGRPGTPGRILLTLGEPGNSSLGFLVEISNGINP